jgi:hypothetical protein
MQIRIRLVLLPRVACYNIFMNLNPSMLLWRVHRKYAPSVFTFLRTHNILEFILLTE